VVITVRIIILNPLVSDSCSNKTFRQNFTYNRKTYNNLTLKKYILVHALEKSIQILIKYQ